MTTRRNSSRDSEQWIPMNVEVVFVVATSALLPHPDTDLAEIDKLIYVTV